MALHWNVERIDNYKALCWTGEGEEREMNPVTKALIFNSIAIGIGEITADNAAEVYARTNILERINGALCFQNGEPSYITEEDITAHIGLWCNVSFETRKQWATRWFIGHGDYLFKHGTKRKSAEEIEHAERDTDTVDMSVAEELARQFRRDQRKRLEKIVEASA